MRLSLFMCLAALAWPQASNPDFRKAAWGMTQAEVQASEASKASDVRQSEGEVILRFDRAQFGALESHVVYVFAKDKLVRAKYLFDVEHAEKNDFIADYKKIEPLLIEHYGKPSSERAFWKSDLYQEEAKSYLDQDRATPSAILASDHNAGLAISEGQLKFYTQWTSPRTKVVHGLTGQEGHILHQVEYSSVELEPLESEARAK